MFTTLCLACAITSTFHPPKVAEEAISGYLKRAGKLTKGSLRILSSDVSDRQNSAGKYSRFLFDGNRWCYEPLDQLGVAAACQGGQVVQVNRNIDDAVDDRTTLLFLYPDHKSFMTNPVSGPLRIIQHLRSEYLVDFFRDHAVKATVLPEEIIEGQACRSLLFLLPPELSFEQDGLLLDGTKKHFLKVHFASKIDYTIIKIEIIDSNANVRFRHSKSGQLAPDIQMPFKIVQEHFDPDNPDDKRRYISTEHRIINSAVTMKQPIASDDLRIGLEAKITYNFNPVSLTGMIFAEGEFETLANSGRLDRRCVKLIDSVVKESFIKRNTNAIFGGLVVIGSVLCALILRRISGKSRSNTSDL
jgi:hypothetical protein